MSNNTKPSTPFGHLFFKLGIWQPHWEKAIKQAYESLKLEERGAITSASGFIAIVNANLQAAPEFIFELVQKYDADLTKEYLTEKLNDLNRLLLKIDANVPDDFNGAITKLQAYLSQYSDKAWAVMTRAAVEVFTDIFLDGKTPLQILPVVLEYVYQMFVKPRVDNIELAGLK